MKKTILTCCLMATLSAYAEEISITINNTTPNNLKSELPIAKWGSINNLTITGPIGNADITFISNVAKATGNLHTLDLTNTTNLLEMPKSAFSGIKSLTYVSLPTSLNTVSEKAFMDCINLTEIKFNEGLTTISDRALCNDSLLTSISLPSTLGDLKITALDGCFSLSEINVATGNPVFSSIFGVLYSKEDLTLIKYPAARTGENFTIPNGVTSIGNNAFNYCRFLNNIEMPATVKSIGKSAFADCSSLKSFIVGNGVSNIEDFAFANCANLESISFPKTLKTIGDALLAKCCKLASIRCEAPNPPTFSPLVDSPFISQDASVCSLNPSTCILSVPNKCQTKYEEAKGWDAFSNIEGFQAGQ